MQTLLAEATSVLRMHKPAKYLFSVGGTQARVTHYYSLSADVSSL